MFPPHPRFVLRRLLGIGGFGAVYEALDREAGITVAIKTLRRASPRALAQFKREFRALTQVSHPNLVVLHELFDQPQWFFSMEFVRGVELLEYVRGEHPQAGATAGGETLDAPPSLAERGEPTSASGLDADGVHRLQHALAQLVEAVAALHEQGQLHRDLKPSNVLVEADGTVKVLDFGLITPLADTNEEIAGTPAYMAPETLQGELSEATDWYSLGVILFVALTGNHPFSSPMSAAAAELDSGPGRRVRALCEVHRVGSAAPPELWTLCEQLLAPDPSQRPGADEILAQLGRTPAPRATSRRTAFVGRDEELGALHRALDSVAAGRPHVLLVHGQSGIGKSTLIDQFVHDVSRIPEALVFEGRCYEQEYVPFQGVDSVLDAICRYLVTLDHDRLQATVPAQLPALARMFPVLQQLTGADEIDRSGIDPLLLRSLAFDALRELLSTLAQDKLVMLVIDDAQWADPDAADIIHSLVNAATPAPVLLLTAWRRAAFEHNALARQLREVGERQESPVAVTAVAVEPLPLRDAKELVQRLAPDHTSGELATLIEDAAGSPLFLAELATALHADAGSQRSPVTDINVMLADKVSRLEAPTRRLLATVCVSGRPLLTSVAVEAANIGESAIRAVQSLIAGRLVQRRSLASQHALSPYHDRIREVVVAGLPTKDRREVHRGLAEALEHSGADPELLLLHTLGAGMTAAAARWAEVAAEQAEAAFAPSRALELLDQAIALDPLHAESSEIWLRRGRLLREMGRVVDSLDSHRRALQLARTEIEQARVWIGLAFGMRISDQLDDAHQALDTAQSLAEPGSHHEELATIHYLRGNLYFPRGRVDECEAEHQRSLRHAELADSPIAQARALSGLGDAAYAQARMVTGRGRIQRCLEVCREHGLLWDAASNGFMLGTVRLYLGEQEGALENCAQSIADAAASGNRRAEIVARLTAAWIHTERADFDRALAEVRTGSEVARALGAQRFEPFLAETQARALLALGDREAAIQVIDRALGACREQELMRFIGPWVLATWALVANDREAQAKALDEATKVLAEGCVGHNHLRANAIAIDVCWALAEPHRCAEYAAALAQYTAREPFPWASFHVDRGRALAEARPLGPLTKRALELGLTWEARRLEAIALER